MANMRDQEVRFTKAGINLDTSQANGTALISYTCPPGKSATISSWSWEETSGSAQIQLSYYGATVTPGYKNVLGHASTSMYAGHYGPVPINVHLTGGDRVAVEVKATAISSYWNAAMSIIEYGPQPGALSTVD